MTVHPHARGDDGTVRGASRTTHGSPPRAWGRRRRSGPPEPALRFTPTRVGTTQDSTTGIWTINGSPPRAWGRRLASAAAINPDFGSPPRAWGRPAGPDPRRHGLPVHPHARGDDERHGHRRRRHDRFTPTRVGTTPRPVPDARGPVGSPPRAWGRRSHLASGRS